MAEKSKTYTMEHGAGSAVKYDVIGKIAEGAKLTRRTTAKILAGVRPDIFAMLQNNPEEFITKAIRLINEEKATMIVEDISYNRTEGKYDSSIFTAEKNSDFSTVEINVLRIRKRAFRLWVCLCMCLCPANLNRYIYFSLK